MRKLFSFLFLFFQSVYLFAQSSPVKEYGDQIKAEELKEYLSIIASDALEGRRTGTRGQKMAAAFIASHFQEIGLKPPVNGTYYQPVELYSSSPAEVYVKAGDQRYDNFTSIFFTGSVETNGEVQSDIVFVGQGRAEEVSQVDIKDKAVLLYTPGASSMSGLRAVASSLREKGAKVIFIVFGGKEDYSSMAVQMKGFLSGGSLGLKKSENKGSFYIDQAVAEKLFKTTFAKLEAAAKADVAKALLKKIKPGKVVYKTSVNVKTVLSENVLGYMEGTDKKDELVIVTAHYDHIGKGNGTTGDQINNGADDDGSGTVAVLEIAKAFAKAKQDGHGPRRSMLFMTVTGEEIGLLGSEYYVEHPVYPLDKTVMDFNIDMIGRRDPEHKDKPDYVYVIGADKLSSELHEINERNNNTYTRLAFDYTYNDENHPTNLYKRSDHWNFAKNGIPIVFFFDGIHEDYHRPSDEVSKIEFDLETKRAQAAFYTIWEVANRDNRLVVDKK